MKILLVDQFHGPSPYWLSTQHPRLTFEVLVERVLAEPQARFGHRSEVLEVPDTFLPPWGTTTFRAGPNGEAQLWRYHWDSSG